MVSRSRDYRSLPVGARTAILEGFFAAFRKPTPREQISAGLALMFGLLGVEPTGVPFERAAFDPPTRAQLDEVFDECADAVLDVLARHGAKFREIA